MNLYDEFFAIIEAFESNSITYAVIGGVALAFHAEPRLTRDIDILVAKNQLQQVEGLLEKLQFFKSTDPHLFTKVNLVLHRFLKIEGKDYLTVDILIGDDRRFSDILQNAEKAEREGGYVNVATKKDLIRLKKFRSSDLDKADIKKLSSDNDEN